MTSWLFVVVVVVLLVVVVLSVVVAVAARFAAFASARGCRLKCVKPFMRGVEEFGCGQCLPCRINRRRTWTFRLCMETTQHRRSLFITLTYAPEKLPAGGSLAPRDTELFLKRLRFAVAPTRLRYYLVGEYGDRTWRPHYHMALFGLEDAVVLGKHTSCSCVLCEAWSMGIVHVGEITLESAAYIASYTVKKMTQVTDPRLGGRHPEFSRMSRRPGIGHSAMAAFKEALIDRNTGEVRLRDDDVPSVARFNGGVWPLGRYLRRALRVQALLRADTPRGVAELRGRELQAQLSQPGALVGRDLAREQRAIKAEVRERIQRSKKGVGL